MRAISQLTCIEPKNEQHWHSLRALDVTSTEVSALFGISPYLSEFELWHRKRDQTQVTFESNERMKWGNRLQDAIAHGIAEDQGWPIRKKTEYIRVNDYKLGASFDFEILESSDKSGLLEIKNVDALQFKDGWLVDGDHVEAPPHIELQVQQQMLVSGKKRAFIGALIGGNRVVMIEREADETIGEAIFSRVSEFWASVAQNRAPQPDFVKDADFISRLYSDAKPGKLLKADDEISALAQEYREASKFEKEYRERKDAVKAQLLMRIADAEKVSHSDFTISCGITEAAQVSYDRAAFRNFRIHWKGKKK